MKQLIKQNSTDSKPLLSFTPYLLPSSIDTTDKLFERDREREREMTGIVMVAKGGAGCGHGKETKGAAEDQQNSISIVEMLLAALRKSMVSCRVDRSRDEPPSAVRHMEIGWPTNVRHVAHVTFDRFNGFLGLPVEFEVEIPGRVPSASASVFGVSAESMQCSYDSRGNSIPTILLLMQDKLYSQGGLKAEGIFRINPENSQEEEVRRQLNSGIVPNNIDVHCLAGLIKAWFRELPSGVLDGLSPEQVLQCNTEEESVELVNQLKPTESALLNWAVDLMADVVEQEGSNKMNARNIAVVFAPNMTQMSDPLTALMHAVQVMNLLKTLITKTLRERDEASATGGGYSPTSSHSSDQQTYDEEIDSQQGMDTSCELRGPVSECDDNTHYSNSSEDEDDTNSLSEVEESFLRQLDDKGNTKILEESVGDLQRRRVSPRSGSTSYRESGVSFSDSKVGSSALSTSDGEDSRASPVTRVQKNDEPKFPLKRGENSNGSDVEMVDKFAESAFPMPLLGVQ